MKIFTALFVLVALAAGFTFAQRRQPQQQQQQQPAASTSPVAPQPAPKSAEEVAAIQAMLAAQDADARITAGEAVITKFPKSEFKSIALLMIASSYEQKGDADNAIAWADKTIESDPASYQAKLLIATQIARRTREHDLDKDEKMARADSLLKSAQADIQAALRPRPDVTDEQWASVKKLLLSQTYEVYGMLALVDKKYDVAAEQFQKSIDESPEPAPTVQIRLAAVYNLQGKKAEAVGVLDKVLATPGLEANIKAVAQREKDKATKQN